MGNRKFSFGHFMNEQTLRARRDKNHLNCYENEEERGKRGKEERDSQEIRVQLPRRSVQLPGRSGQFPGRSVQLPGGSVQLPRSHVKTWKQDGQEIFHPFYFYPFSLWGAAQRAPWHGSPSV